MKEISIIIPLYNEDEIINKLYGRINNIIDTFPDKTIEVLFIDDGSTDRTSEILQQICFVNEKYKYLQFSRNFGHQIAISAGIKYAEGSEGIMIIDGDLQDPPEMLTDFYAKYKEGYDVIFGVRKKRKEGFLKKTCYYLYYRILKKVSNINIPIDSGDFCFLSRKVVNVINKMPEESRFLRGMRSWVGFIQTGIEYDRDERYAGKSKYSIAKLITLAFNGFFNFSELPIRFITKLGMLTLIGGLIYLLYVLICKYFYNGVPQGFTSLIIIIILFSGVQLISIGIIGEYVLRIFFQVKNRPLFVVKKYISDKQIVNE